MDPRKMMKQVARMQAELAKAQEELAGAESVGEAGNGAVGIVLTGAEGCTGVRISESAIDPEDPSLLEDLVRAAINEALRAQQELTEQKLGGMTGGLDVPGLGG